MPRREGMVQDGLESTCKSRFVCSPPFWPTELVLQTAISEGTIWRKVVASCGSECVKQQLTAADFQMPRWH